MKEKYGYGFKALDPTGATYNSDGEETCYPLPRPGEKWGPWLEHPCPAQRDGNAYGAGRFHVWNHLWLEHAPPGAWPWFAEWRTEITSDGKRVGTERLRLRRISPRVLWRALRPPFNWGRGADLYRATLTNAELVRADFTGAKLTLADLTNANLTDANLAGAYLVCADLTHANLYGADLTNADLRNARLRCANLHGAILDGAILDGADFSGADLD